MVQVNEAFPGVTVIILNYNGKHHLQDCFNSLEALEYAGEIEVMLVDNASFDGSVDFVKSNFPEVSIVETGDNYGFAKGNNIGAEQAAHGLIAFLNSDTRVDKNWLTELVRPFVEGNDPELACTSSKSIGWNGVGMDSPAPVNITAYPTGVPPEHKNPDEYEKDQYHLFPFGGSMLIKKDVFLDVGGFDEDYFMYLEDVDLGWRLWLMGYKVINVPSSKIWHKGAGSRSEGNEKIYALTEKNALETIIKNYDDVNLSKILPLALFLQVRRFMYYANIDASSFEIGSKKKIPNAQLIVSRMALTPLIGIQWITDSMDKVVQKRERIQKNRKRSDEEIFALVDEPFNFIINFLGEEDNQKKLIDSFGIEISSLKRKSNHLCSSINLLREENAGGSLMDLLFYLQHHTREQALEKYGQSKVSELEKIVGMGSEEIGAVLRAIEPVGSRLVLGLDYQGTGVDGALLRRIRALEEQNRAKEVAMGEVLADSKKLLQKYEEREKEYNSKQKELLEKYEEQEKHYSRIITELKNGA